MSISDEHLKNSLKNVHYTKVYDIKGKEVKQASFNNTTFTLPVNDLSQGIYTITISSPSEQTSIKFVIE
jgi:hypothetical protein